MSTASVQAGGRWWEEVRPQVSIVVVFLVLLLALSLQNRVTDPDFWWHLRTGQWILKEMRIPYTDAYSYTMQGQPWIAHSWLAEIAMYLLYQYIGPFILPLLRSLLQVATMALLLKMLWQRWPRLWGSMALILVAFFASTKFWLVRPNSASLVLFVAILYLWYRYKWQGRDQLWLLPMLMALWANLHSGYIYGLLLLGALSVGEVLAGRFWPDPVPLERKRWLRLGLFSLLSVPAVLLNPYGVHLLLYPFTYYLGGISLHTGYVGEWLSPNFHEFSNILLALLILALIATMAWRRSTMGPAETLALLLFVGLSLSSVRAAGVAIPLLIWSLAGVLGQGVAPRAGTSRRGAWPQPTKAVLWGWYGGTMLLVMLLLAAAALQFAFWGRAAGFIEEQGYPKQAVTELSTLPAEARIFNSYNWGGYLIWKHPDRLVFIDGRADLYGDDLFAEYMHVWKAGPNWSDVLDKYAVDVVLCERPGPLATVLTASTAWESCYADETAAVFQRAP